MSGFNFSEDIKIDPNALDVEWLKQPQLFLAVAEEAAYAREKMDRAKEKFDVARAELASDIRSKPDTYDIVKLTEGSLNEVLAVTLGSNNKRKRDKQPLVENNTLQLHYKEANEEYIKARTEHELTVAAVRAFDQRKVALENLVRLQGQSYFAGPKEPRDLGREYSMDEQAREKRSEKASEKIATRMSSRRKR